MMAMEPSTTVDRDFVESVADRVEAAEHLPEGSIMFDGGRLLIPADIIAHWLDRLA